MSNQPASEIFPHDVMASAGLGAEIRPAPASLKIADGAAIGTPPAVHALEQILDGAVLDMQAGLRWPRRRTALFVILTCGAFWSAAVLFASHL